MPTKLDGQTVGMNREIMRNAFGSLITLSKKEVTPFRRSNNDLHSNYVVDSSLFTRFKRLQSGNKEYTHEYKN
jgi:hypothetical protein